MEFPKYSDRLRLKEILAQIDIKLLESRLLLGEMEVYTPSIQAVDRVLTEARNQVRDIKDKL